ncbi:MAG: cation:proton antiporter [Desulfurococcales archaeon]|nr:cation:proton antiporter [Desulfurococcales archaeon]
MPTPFKARGRRESAVAGLTLSAIVLVGSIALHDKLMGHPGLYSLSAISFLLAGAALLAEALDVAPAVVELVLGVLAAEAGVPSVEGVELLALVGSVFIMYMAGLEIDPHLLRRNLLSSTISGVVSFLAPMVVAALGVHHFLGYTWEQSLLAAIGTATTSVAVVYAIIRRGGLTRRPIGQIILATAMVADVASILAFVAVEAGISVVVGLYLVGIVAVIILLARFFEWASGGLHEVELKLILAFLTAAALISEYVGVHAILFAFLLGIATRDTVEKSRDLGTKLTALTFGVLAPIFFIDAGLHAKPEHPLLYAEIAALLLLLTFPAKVLFTHAALKALTGSRRVRLKLTSVFGARLTVSTVIAFTGEATGKLPHDLAGAIIMSALIATIAAAAITRSPIPEEIPPS